MKLYITHDGAWTLPGQQPKDAERVDLPGSPPDMAGWLNERRVPPHPPVAPDAAAEPAEAPPAPAGASPPEAVHAASAALQAGADAVSEWILDRASPAQIEGNYILDSRNRFG